MICNFSIRGFPAKIAAFDELYTPGAAGRFAKVTVDPLPQLPGRSRRLPKGRPLLARCSAKTCSERRFERRD
jgi:hypothetical protein